MGPLQYEIATLVAHGVTTNRAILLTLSYRYSISPETVKVTLARLVQRGIIQRTARGVYAYQPENITSLAQCDHYAAESVGCSAVGGLRLDTA